MGEYVQLPRRKLHWYYSIADFANIFKAFIGTNYLSLAYGFKQSGLGFGIAGLLLVAVLTGHCCRLIVKCKHIVIDDLCRKYELSKEEDNDADLSDMAMFRIRLLRRLDYTDIGRLICGRWGGFVVNFCLVVTQVGFCVGYFIFIGNTVHETNTASSSTPTTIEDFVLEPVNATTTSSYGRTRVQLGAVSTKPDNTTRLSNVTDVPKVALWLVHSGPPLALLVLSPLPLLIIFTFFRTVRQMALISVGANIAILIGLFSVLFYILTDFHPSPTIVWYRWVTLPVFFGQLTGAYEAIGIIIPIESSMEGNQHMFPGCLSGAISIFTGLLGALAVVGYVQFGEDTDQIIAQNLATDNVVGLLINITLILGVVCTYPLQVFPVVEIVEGLLFADGKVCGPKTVEQIDEFDLSDNEDNPEKTLLSMTEPQLQLPVAVFVSKSVPAWKRNLLRSAVAIVIALIAVMLRRVFAYVGALVGAIGSSPLVFIMPCLFHFKLRRHQVSPLVLAKDVAIIVFGAIAGLLSFIVVVQEIIERA
ncbi:Proton-coupled amino acid transporter 2 [Lamellibrachia satsuma]|nr:Proton-coupled amino acid transporter 2 [Lamellibrachia satsuma]